MLMFLFIVYDLYKDNYCKFTYIFFCNLALTDVKFIANYENSQPFSY